MDRSKLGGAGGIKEWLRSKDTGQETVSLPVVVLLNFNSPEVFESLVV